MSKTLLSVVIPAYNEGKRIAGTINKVERYFNNKKLSFEIVIASDGSTDKTVNVVRDKQKTHSNLSLIDLSENLWKGGAVQAGMLAAKGEYILLTDTDLATSINEFEKLFQKLKSGFPIAIASRSLPESRIISGYSNPRNVLSLLFGFLIKSLVVHGIVDTQCGFKLFTKKAAKNIFRKSISRSPLWDVDVLAYSAEFGYKVAEVPISWCHNPDSRLKYDPVRAFKVLFELIKIKLKHRIFLPLKVDSHPVIHCHLCGRKKVEGLFVKDQNHIVLCHSCGLIFVHPQPELSTLKSFYTKEYYDLESSDRPPGTSGYRSCLKCRTMYNDYFAKKLDQIERFGPPGKILDIGCGMGFFLDCARLRGWETYGIEISSYCVQYARHKLGLNIFQGPVEKAKFPENKFDVVTILQTVEHIPDPITTLTEIYRVLKPHGVLLVSTPNINSGYTKAMGKYSFQFGHGEHLFYFSEKTLGKAINRSHFKDIAIFADVPWSIPIEDLLERIEHFYPGLAILLRPVRNVIDRTILKVLRVPLPFGDIVAVARK